MLFGHMVWSVVKVFAIFEGSYSHIQVQQCLSDTSTLAKTNLGNIVCGYFTKLKTTFHGKEIASLVN
ncbi:hypothetical protein ERO13_A12G192101v2 [Gossypium hirsutum]|nr:hypothetical protein ERO13_A12G192101v2 [Gossypium hirsutum]KAG4171165.1 hypothetical protein ERO13_A12G192101v2 [Gossypium hirsutum]